MNTLIASWSLGLILALLGLGVFVSFRVFRFSDITVDGSFTLGAAVSAVLLIGGTHPLLASGCAFLAGMAAGATTGVLHTKFKINPLLSGILVMTALYSINLRVMGKSNVPLGEATCLATYARELADWLTNGQPRPALFGWEVSATDLIKLFFSLVVCVSVGLVLFVFFRTDLGTAVRATGDNDQMIRALGVNVDRMIIGGLALSNGLVALAGSLFVQEDLGPADVQMGIGMVVWGLGSVLIGEALVGGQHHIGLSITGTVMGSILFRLIVALVLRAGLNANDLKLFTAVFVFVALVLPDLLRRLRSAVGGSWRAGGVSPLLKSRSQ